MSNSARGLWRRARAKHCALRAVFLHEIRHDPIALAALKAASMTLHDLFGLAEWLAQQSEEARRFKLPSLVPQSQVRVEHHGVDLAWR